MVFDGDDVDEQWQSLRSASSIIQNAKCEQQIVMRIENLQYEDNIERMKRIELLKEQAQNGWICIHF